jgi:methionine-rich copper-binding protein CopC
MIVVVLMALACWVSAAGTAAAHTALAGSDPAEGATAETVPAAVTLTFTEDINPTFATVVINSSDGRNWVSGPAQVTGPRLSVSVSPDLPDGGDYTVGYRVVSADGHPVSGSFTFTVAPASGAPASTSSSPSGAPPTPAGPPPTTAAPSPAAGPIGSDTKGSIITAAVAGLLLGAAIAFWQSRRRRRKVVPDDEPPSPSIDPPS